MKSQNIFLEHWNKIKDPRTQDYQIKKDFVLKNGAKADIAIFLKDQCVAFGSFFIKLELPRIKNDRLYFHGNNSFLGCGTISKIWFYYDENKIILNDLNLNYPFDELMDNYESFFQRLINEY